MKVVSIDRLNPARPMPTSAPRVAACAPEGQTHHSLDLLQCTQCGESGDDRPDVRYWIAYDYFMVEHEARAARNAYLYGMIAKACRSFIGRLRHGRKLVRPDGIRGG